jgi:hypothetical protein
MTRAGRLIALAVACAIVLGACDGGDPEPDPTTAGPSRIASTGSIAVVEPEAGAAVPGPSVHVQVALEGATIAEEVSADIRPDVGHIHVKLDGETITLLAGLEYTIEGVAPGPHVLEVEFAASDHGPFAPRVVQTVAFTVT